jgi:hypothetical protein
MNFSRRRFAPAAGKAARLAPLEAERLHGLPLEQVPPLQHLRPSCPWQNAAPPTRTSLASSVATLSGEDGDTESVQAEAYGVDDIDDVDDYDSMHFADLADLIEEHTDDASLNSREPMTGDADLHDCASDVAIPLEVTLLARSSTMSSTLGANARAEVERAVHSAFLEECTRGNSPTAAAAEAIRRCRSTLSRESLQAAQACPPFNESHTLLLKEGEDAMGVKA